MNRPSIAIVTPWRDQLQFLPGYLQAVQGAEEVIVIDGGCSPEPKRALMEAFGGLVHLPGDFCFGAACNKGIQASTADIIVMLNNDVVARGPWLDMVRAQVGRGGLYGPELLNQHIQQAGVIVPFLSAWCVAARREVWKELGGFDTERFVRGYWEDNDLCFRAMTAGFSLVKTDWPIVHLAGPGGVVGNNTARAVPEYYQSVDRNRAAFVRRVMEHILPAQVEEVAA